MFAVKKLSSLNLVASVIYYYTKYICILHCANGFSEGKPKALTKFQTLDATPGNANAPGANQSKFNLIAAKTKNFVVLNVYLIL